MPRRALTAVVAAALAYTAVPAAHGDRIVRVYGDLSAAERVAVVVPGSDTTAANFDGGRADPYSTPAVGARTVLAEARALDPGARLAVVAWLGYDSPATESVGALTDRAARRGAAELRHFLAGTAFRGKRVSLLCHSYGSVVCALAARGSGVESVAVFGSPGLGVSSAAELGVPLWAGSGSGDWMRRVPKVRLGPLGFGPDPAGAGFGARVFAAGGVGHSGYLHPGTESLRNLTLIALGRTGEVSRG
ncbi:alpha/beta hydrolase [Streptosporangium sp. NPDC048047]|uniref:alpha/beta hydrolase n=1 Tax=Streptosporangium sp. NPDC048047 TaxID=3155748 RepID=UPI0034344A51